jgi:hypothetical protein
MIFLFPVKEGDVPGRREKRYGFSRPLFSRSAFALLRPPPLPPHFPYSPLSPSRRTTELIRPGALTLRFDSM